MPVHAPPPQKMNPVSMPDPHALLKPLDAYIVEDLSNADIAATGKLAASILGQLSEPVLQLLEAASVADEIALEFFPDPDDESTPGTLIFWPPTRTSRTSPYDDAHEAEYSLRLSVFLSERDDLGAIYPAGFRMVLGLYARGCGLSKDWPPAVFERLEFQVNATSRPGGFEVPDDSQLMPVLPNMRRQFLRAI